MILLLSLCFNQQIGLYSAYVLAYEVLLGQGLAGTQKRGPAERIIQKHKVQGFCDWKLMSVCWWFVTGAYEGEIHRHLSSLISDDDVGDGSRDAYGAFSWQPG